MGRMTLTYPDDLAEVVRLTPGELEAHVLLMAALKMFELGMPPHGGLAIGLERLTAQILGLQNVREATLYPRDRQHVSP